LDHSQEVGRELPHPSAEYRIGAARAMAVLVAAESVHTALDAKVG